MHEARAHLVAVYGTSSLPQKGQPSGRSGFLGSEVGKVARARWHEDQVRLGYPCAQSGRLNQPRQATNATNNHSLSGYTDLISAFIGTTATH